MTDLKTFLLMLANSDCSFMKEQSGNQCWRVVILNATRIEVEFDKDGKFKYVYAKDKSNV